MSRINDLTIDFLAQQRIAVAGVSESLGTAPRPSFSRDLSRSP